MKKKLAVIFLTLSMVLAGLTPLDAVKAAGTDIDSAAGLVTYADAASYTDPGFTGKTCTSNKTAAATIDYIMYLYPQYSQYPGTGQCWGYAETVSNLLAASRTTKYYEGLKFTKTNFKNKCLGVKAGTHLRLSNSKTFNGDYGHSVVLLKVTENKVIWADNNGSGYNTVAYHSSTLDGFCGAYSYQFQYINMVSAPTKYRIVSEPKLAVASDSEAGTINLAWTRASGATQYYVYRSYSKNGTYKRIGKTTSASFADSTAKLGTTAYYKIKAVKKSSSTLSSIKSGMLCLAAPKVTAGNDSKTGQIQLFWEPVPGATSYTIYRWDYSSGKYKKLKNTTKCIFTDATLEEDTGQNWMWYGVKAVYSKNTKANSDYGETIGSIRPPAPQNLTAVQSAGEIQLTWTPVSGSREYIIWVSSAEDGEYRQLGWTMDASYTGLWDEPGTWYFKVSTYYGMESEPVSVCIS